MRQKARIIAKLAAKYRALAFFVNGRGNKTHYLTPAVNQGNPEYGCFRGLIDFVNPLYSESQGLI